MEYSYIQFKADNINNTAQSMGDFSF
jgi:hypothetical protein